MKLKDFFMVRQLSCPEIEISGISTDSRQVNPGNLFVCLPSLSAGKDRSGNYIEQALENDAIAVMAEDQYAQYVDDRACFIGVRNPRLELARLCTIFYKKQPSVIIAVTGTNGKSSVAHFTYQLWRNLGKESAFLGTLGMESTESALVTGLALHTTPDTVALHKTLSKCVDYGINYLALEASSHGLDQYRLDGVRIKAAAYTNLSHDHLDYHKDFSSYFAAKARLFRELLPIGGTAVINKDDPYADVLISDSSARGIHVLTVGEGKADIAIESVSATDKGFNVVARYLDKDYLFHLPLIGRFQVDNALLAAGLMLATGFDFKRVVKALETLKPVNGRMQKVEGNHVFVDYAHTPDALQAALISLKQHVKGKLWVVFGCGGDRDQQKRPLMGQIATKYADRVVITDDNPRHENPEIIHKQIALGCCDPEVIPDRAAAIKFAIENKAAEDLVLIAGKGHEKYQWIGNQKVDFDDVAVAKNVIKLNSNI